MPAAWEPIDVGRPGRRRVERYARAAAVGVRVAVAALTAAALPGLPDRRRAGGRVLRRLRHAAPDRRLDQPRIAARVRRAAG